MMGRHATCSSVRLAACARRWNRDSSGRRRSRRSALDSSARSQAGWCGFISTAPASLRLLRLRLLRLRSYVCCGCGSGCCGCARSSGSGLPQETLVATQVSHICVFVCVHMCGVTLCTCAHLRACRQRLVKFAVLEGAQEATWEYDAAQLIWGADASKMFPAAAAFGDTAPEIGLFSGGGKSMQLGRRGAALSFPFSTFPAELEERKGAAPDAWLDPVKWDRCFADVRERAPLRMFLFKLRRAPACVGFQHRALQVPRWPLQDLVAKVKRATAEQVSRPSGHPSASP